MKFSASRQNIVKIPGWQFIRFLTRWTGRTNDEFERKSFSGYLSHVIPAVFLVIFVMDFSDWVVNGEYFTDAKGRVVPVPQSKIISMMSYMNFGFLLNAKRLQRVITQLCERADAQNIPTSFRRWSARLKYHYGLLALLMLTCCTTFVGQAFDFSCINRQHFWAVLPYLVWQIPAGVFTITFRTLMLVSQLLPVPIYIIPSSGPSAAARI